MTGVTKDCPNALVSNTQVFIRGLRQPHALIRAIARSHGGAPALGPEHVVKDKVDLTDDLQSLLQPFPREAKQAADLNRGAGRPAGGEIGDLLGENELQD